MPPVACLLGARLTRAQLLFVSALFVVSDFRDIGAALNVGCGCTGRFLDLLIENEFTAEGVDASSEMVALAQKRHPDLRFYHQDICTWSPSKNMN
ncbi:class I SAM-dependent methyltransferase [Congregibacter variabilis]|uniref:class I SAM-dependent methyltransferase n=1 Tax=Congregibacter variabilis TaxID=3081200 RepID=UPI00389026A4